MNNHINVVSFDIPYPADYGGVIDVYHKLLAIKDAGYKIILHCFQYSRPKAPNLEQVCDKIYYYKRKDKSIRAILSIYPYIVKSRENNLLLENLLTNNHPILFEGIHSCAFLNHPLLVQRKKIVRIHNIEHHYYWNLFKSESNLLKKIYFLTESAKLLWFEKKIKKADLLLTLSETDKLYLERKFPEQAIINTGPFFEKGEVKSLQGKGHYLLFHGNLGVAENHDAARYLINALAETDYKLIITGKNPSEKLISLAKKHATRIELIKNPEQDQLEGLIQNAHAVLLFTFQNTGIKLKMFSSLIYGRFCIANRLMSEGTKLESFFEEADNAEQLREVLKRIISRPFPKEEKERRKFFFNKYFATQKEELVNILKNL